MAFLKSESERLGELQKHSRLLAQSEKLKSDCPEDLRVDVKLEE